MKAQKRTEHLCTSVAQNTERATKQNLYFICSESDKDGWVELLATSVWKVLSHVQFTQCVPAVCSVGKDTHCAFWFVNECDAARSYYFWFLWIIWQLIKNTSKQGMVYTEMKHQLRAVYVELMDSSNGTASRHFPLEATNFLGQSTKPKGQGGIRRLPLVRVTSINTA